MNARKLNKTNDEVVGDNPEAATDRVKMIVSEATTSTHIETILDRVTERRTEASDSDLKLHALNYAMNNTYVVERSADEGQLSPAEYAQAMTDMADQYLAWLKA